MMVMKTGLMYVPDCPRQHGGHEKASGPVSEFEDVRLNPADDPGGDWHLTGTPIHMILLFHSVPNANSFNTYLEGALPALSRSLLFAPRRCPYAVRKLKTDETISSQNAYTFWLPIAWC